MKTFPTKQRAEINDCASWIVYPNALKKGCGIILIFGCTYIYASSERVVHVFRGVKQTTIWAATGFDCNTNKIVEKSKQKNQT